MIFDEGDVPFKVDKIALKLERIGLTFRQNLSVEAQDFPDYGDIAYRLESFVLQDHIADDYYEEVYRDNWPATTWQMFKFTHMLSWWLGWLVRRWPVRYTENRHVVRVKVGRYLNYPEANLGIKQLGRSVITERITRLTKEEIESMDAAKLPKPFPVYLLIEETIPMLVEDTGLEPEFFKDALSYDREFGLNSKIYVIPGRKNG